jgi:hypothetical protein
MRCVVVLAGVITSVVCFSGCKSEGKTDGHDLDAVVSSVRTGMTEVEVVSHAGVPDKIEIEGEYRNLRYESTAGKSYVEVSLKNNTVVDVSRRD